jgi:hypothetical protein
MSRSYKQTPVWKNGRPGRFGKKLANRKIRRYKEDISDGGQYRKLYESWNIHNFISYYPFSEYLKERNFREKIMALGMFPESRIKAVRSFDENRWAKFYRRK